MDITERDRQDQACMKRLTAGEDSALSELMASHAPALFQFLYRLLNNEADARDLAQEVFVRVYQHRSSFRAEARFTTWLYTIAGNLARNQYRWRSRHPNLSLEIESPGDSATLADTLATPAPSPSDNLSSKEQMEIVRNAVINLPMELREAIVLCEWEEMSIAEASKVLNTTAKGVESRLYRARQLLKKQLISLKTNIQSPMQQS